MNILAEEILTCYHGGLPTAKNLIYLRPEINLNYYMKIANVCNDKQQKKQFDDSSHD